MLETDISQIVSNFLVVRGYRVYAEVPIPYWNASIDLVAEHPKINYPIAIELKSSATIDLVYQAARRQIITPYVWGVISTMPNQERIEKFAKVGIGLATVKSGNIKILTRPWQRIYPKKKIDIRTGIENGNGGIPSPNPRVITARRVIEYLKDHPDARWGEIYQNVPNHYASSKSMGSSLHDFIWAWETRGDIP